MTYDGSSECRHATMSRLASFVFAQEEQSVAKPWVVQALSQNCMPFAHIPLQDIGFLFYTELIF